MYRGRRSLSVQHLRLLGDEKAIAVVACKVALEGLEDGSGDGVAAVPDGGGEAVLPLGAAEQEHVVGALGDELALALAPDVLNLDVVGQVQEEGGDNAEEHPGRDPLHLVVDQRRQVGGLGCEQGVHALRPLAGDEEDREEEVGLWRPPQLAGKAAAAALWLQLCHEAEASQHQETSVDLLRRELLAPDVLHRRAGDDRRLAQAHGEGGVGEEQQHRLGDAVGVDEEELSAIARRQKAALRREEARGIHHLLLLGEVAARRHLAERVPRDGEPALVQLFLHLQPLAEPKEAPVQRHCALLEAFGALKDERL
mmetsp:Transcript_15101/g.59119  ORF Transcript_15101/g.59119 Transcript_15101/m.59119 type:complete len:311 (+) Transcript_15101:2071-3003(+)